MKVWTWTGRDPSSLADLEFVVAVANRSGLNAVRARLHLPKPDRSCCPSRPDPEADGFLLAAPGRVFWRDLGAARSTGWLDEEALTELRAGSRTRRLGAGRYVVPLHRPDPPRTDVRPFGADD